MSLEDLSSDKPKLMLDAGMGDMVEKIWEPQKGSQVIFLLSAI